MNCQDVQKFAFTYLDAEFDARERGEFEEHLRLCCDCRTIVSRDAMMKDLVARHLHATPCQVEQLRARVCQGIDRSQRRQIQTSIGVSVAVLAVMVVTVGQVLPGDHPGRGDSQESDNAGRIHGDRVNSAGFGGGLAGGRSAPQGQAVAGKQVAPVDVPGNAQGGKVAVAAVRPSQPSAAAQLAGGQGARGQVVPQALPAARVALGPMAAAGPGGRSELADDSGLGRGGAMQRVSARLDLGQRDLGQRGLERRDDGEVLAGTLPPGALTERSPFGAVRSEDSLRQMVQVHLANLPPEVAGTPARVQRYLQMRVPGAGALPLAEGAGITLRGARISVIGGQLAVLYSYVAYGSPLTVIGRARAQGQELDVEQAGPDQRGPSGLVLDHRAGLQLLHVVSHQQVLTLVGDLPAPAMLQLLPAGSLL